MNISFGPRGILQIDDARIIWPNFEGRESLTLKTRCKMYASPRLYNATSKGFNRSVFGRTTMVSRRFFSIGNILTPTVGPTYFPLERRTSSIVCTSRCISICKSVIHQGIYKFFHVRLCDFNRNNVLVTKSLYAFL